jgi:hypothetical protein
MTQNINLLVAERGRRPDNFSGSTIITVITLALIVSLAFSAYQLIKNKKYLNEITQLEQKRSLQMRRSKITIKKFPPNMGNTVLLKQLEKIKSERLAKLQLVELLVDDAFPPGRDGFATSLSSLGRQHIDGMWLTSIQFKRGGKDVELKGATLNAELIPEYIAKLANEKALSGKYFSKFELKRNKKRPQETNEKAAVKNNTAAQPQTPTNTTTQKDNTQEATATPGTPTEQKTSDSVQNENIANRNNNQEDRKTLLNVKKGKKSVELIEFHLVSVKEKPKPKPEDIAKAAVQADQKQTKGPQNVISDLLKNLLKN